MAKGHGREEPRAQRDEVQEFTSEMGAAPAAPAEVEEANDPEGYVGADGKAAPHEQPWEVREQYDEEVDELDTVSFDQVADRGSGAGNVRTGGDADAATG
jgi:hypothetical protein